MPIHEPPVRKTGRPVDPSADPFLIALMLVFVKTLLFDTLVPVILASFFISYLSNYCKINQGLLLMRKITIAEEKCAYSLCFFYV